MVATTFREFPSFPQRYIERAPSQPACEADTGGVLVESLRLTQPPAAYTEHDLHIRRFRKKTLRRLAAKGEFRAA